MAPLMPCRRRDLLRFVTGRSGCFRRLYGTGPGAAQRRLHTMDAAQPAAQAVAISGARFLAAASNPDILRLATVRTRKMDLGGETVVPGFVDPTPIRPPPVCAICARWIVICGRLRPLSRPSGSGRRPPGEWVVGFKYDDTKTADSGLYNKMVKLHGKTEILQHVMQ
jgi:hypothetical protein